MHDFCPRAARNLAAVRQHQPLIHNITNLVVMNVTANALLAAGASPVMAHSPDEVEEMVALARALVLNIGTLTSEWVATMIKAARKANALERPVVLDPVGAGATGLRTRAARQILEAAAVTVIRGNASEIMALDQGTATTRGVDSVHGVNDAAASAARLAQRLGVVVAVTGATDLVTDGAREVRVANGHPLMGRITGSGCTATALIAAFLAVDPDPLSAAATALAFFGLAGEQAGAAAAAPGSFQVALLDALYTLGPEALQEESRFA
ncbi:MAG TPA: hydroxyethylthiazole kinase [Desulfobacteraceae bacterium]|nr:hydroxyethylthiazole kinase [Deltaproteobacteria bacterium]RLB99351.1 MAG: hydroxyethylthiazole kinase [Deltaproteobacteria bacterium]HDI59143.1 hydroxyethylthiazole kinase [Desulfobacteraceae bacterium]